MGISLLPDRETRHLLQFHVLPRLGYRTRLAVAAALIVGGLALQWLWESAPMGTLLGSSLPLLFAGNLLLLAKGYDLKPRHAIRSGTWEKTTRDRFEEIRRLEHSVRRWDETFSDVTCVTGIFSLLAVGVAGLFLFGFLESRNATSFWAPVFVADAAVLLLPHWVTGLRRGWRPVGLRQQIDALETALQAIQDYKDPPCQIQPMFEMSGEPEPAPQPFRWSPQRQIQPMVEMSGKEEKRLPIAARVFIRFPDGPEDFLGLQFQVALNDVQGTKYPYLYAVIIAKEKFGLLKDSPSEQAAQRLRKLTVERKTDREVDVIVIRQRTTENSGYHTKPKAIRDIARGAWETAGEILHARRPLCHETPTGSK